MDAEARDSAQTPHGLGPDRRGLLRAKAEAAADDAPYPMGGGPTDYDRWYAMMAARYELHKLLADGTQVLALLDEIDASDLLTQAADKELEKAHGRILDHERAHELAMHMLNEAKARLEALEAMLAEVAWQGDPYIDVAMCVVCPGEQPNHAPDCALAKLLG